MKSARPERRQAVSRSFSFMQVKVSEFPLSCQGGSGLEPSSDSSATGKEPDSSPAKIYALQTS
jgi:hypothetical protein